MTQFASEGQASHAEELSFAESELKVALLLADLSSAAYRVGRLRRACDARSKAESLCTRAAARLRRPDNSSRAESMVSEVLDKLARLPEFNFQAGAAG